MANKIGPGSNVIFNQEHNDYDGKEAIIEETDGPTSKIRFKDGHTLHAVNCMLTPVKTAAENVPQE